MALFSQLLRLHKGNIPLEDFFTEVVAYFLSKNKEILFSWLKHNDILNSEDYLAADITTQKTYKHPINGDKRPDIVIELSNGESCDLIFIESKVGSSEGYNQLSDYAEILNQLPEYRHKFLIYVTRDFDPKKESKIFENIPDVIRNFNVKFKQLRWHQFYQFLTTQVNSEISQEITIFMQEHRMAQSNQFSPVDISALVNFLPALKLMEAVMWGKVVAQFEKVLGRNKKREIAKRHALQWIQWHGRYILVSQMPDGWSCFMGFFMQPVESVDSSGYPSVQLVLQVEPKSPKRQEIINGLRQIANDSSWHSYNLDASSTWSGITLQRSLREFLSMEDHVSAIEDFFLEALSELKNIRQQYPQLPWGSVIDEDVIDEDKDEDENVLGEESSA
ncbi:PD-(D/E)XK nuclease family protein [Leptolyngbya sp. PCC 6406]|uniref:PD-(D/E)XK nuclease family protein n=1 Tax=Leptolyngbya sp. PCC 6406 TaxID=1173264 RepID=UPI0002ACBED4|nr:PD-(D/E)XK nuclease family protein [Leptolyngbya sp. PCC 6406]